MGVNFLAGTSASISAGVTTTVNALYKSTVFGGAKAELTSLGKTSVTAVGKVVLTSGKDVHIHARTGDAAITGKRIQLGYAKTAAELMTSPQARPDQVDALLAGVSGMQATVGGFVGALAVADADPVVAAAAAFFAGTAVLAQTEHVIAAQARTEAIAKARGRATPPTTVLDPIRALDAHMPEVAASPDPRSGDTPPKAALRAESESIMQEETSDLFLKAKNTIRFKSNDEIYIGAAKSFAVRVGNMMVKVTHDDSSDKVSIGVVEGANPTEMLYPRIALGGQEGGEVTLELKTSADTTVKLSGERTVRMAAGSASITINHDGAIILRSGDGAKVITNGVESAN